MTRRVGDVSPEYASGWTGGFRKVKDWPRRRPCSHPEHNPLASIVLPPGYYEYKCPGCGKVTPVVVPEVLC